MICTIPWNVLGDIKFEPPLASEKNEVFHNVSMAILPKYMPKWLVQTGMSGIHTSASGRLTAGIQYLASSGCTPAGNTTMVAFSLRDASRKELALDDDPQKSLAAIENINPHMKVQKLVSTHYCPMVVVFYELRCFTCRIAH